MASIKILVCLGVVLLLVAVGCRNPDVYDFDGDGTVDAMDCDPNDASIHPLADEDCADGIDNDCDGDIDGDDNDCDGDDDTGDDDDTTDDDDDTSDDDDDDTGDDDDTMDDDDDTSDDDDDTASNVDADGDDYTPAQGDCNDAEQAVNPDATEIADGLDNNCDGLTDNDVVTCDITVPVQYSTISDAIDAAAQGDVICVETGYYNDSLDYNGKAVHVLGIHGRTITTVDANYTGPVAHFTCSEGPASVLEGVTLIHGSTLSDAGAIDLYDSTPVLTRLVIKDSSGGCGGGIFMENASPTIRDVLIENNYASWEGGGMHVYNSHPTLEHVQIIGNDSGAGGGGIRVSATSTVNGNNLLIKGNMAQEYGGGLLSDDSTLTLTHTTFVGNEAGWAGGGMFLNTGLGSISHLDNVAFLENNTDQDGGAIATYEGELELNLAALVGNFALNTGGGVAVLQPDCLVTLTNTIIYDNLALSDGGGVHYVAGTIAVQNSDTYGNTPVDYGGFPDPTGVDGNVSIDPGFINTTDPDPLAWDLHLDAAGNPLVDAGHAAVNDPDGSTSDPGIYGGPDAGGWDRDQDGYFEWWLPGPYDAATSPGMDCDDWDPMVYPGSGC